LAIESDKNAVATYRKNFCGRRRKQPIVVEGDISRLNAGDLYAQTYPDNSECDLILGGPPCQGYSTHRINGAGIKDERNDLIHVYFEFVKAFKPKAFLMENVPGMLWPRHKSHLQRFYSEGWAASYQMYEPITLDARDYGVPQRRKRVFILGVRHDLPIDEFQWPPTPTHGSDSARKDDPTLAPWVSCRTVFRAAPKGDPNNKHMNHSAELVRTFKNTPRNGGSRKDSGRELACHKNHDGHKDVYGRIDPNLPAPTMTTACINPSKGRFVHPTQHHGITVRQAARIQSFPDDFIFEGGLIAAGQQVGNAVPIKLGNALLTHIRKSLFQLDTRTRKATRAEQPATVA